jgi:hypothetical protein
MIFARNFLGIIEKREKMGGSLENAKVSIPYFETPCKFERKFSFDIVSST